MCTGAWLRATRAIMSRSCSMTVEPPGTVEVGRGARSEIHAAQSQAHELEQIRLIVHDQHHGPIGRTARARRRLVHQISHRRGSANTSLKTLPPPARGS